ncbi:hypothetical protein SRB5_36750 [Streptomyces sp. RB5]|uniref:AsnC family transcriptional regulator n=1 Tax=Streptomyces smaragdinus TaxID=2585196 RepID=A0A7K0CJ80_9ACTN|nr:AsnC family transcriptional regulator [Streptomyces smaragdinus]MQY13527.1 hypothetical protein [Streptomyces smaragdinus]
MKSVVTEVDLTLIDALRLAPRASWAQLSAVLRVSPDTLARRWARLTEQGCAWAGALPLGAGETGLCAAWLEVDCVPGQADVTATALVDDPGNLFVAHVTGRADLLAQVIRPDPADIDRYVTERVHRLPGVRATRLRLITSVYGRVPPGPHGRLTPAQRGRLVELGPQPARGAFRVEAPDRAGRRLLLALAEDARRSAAALAEQCGLSESTVRRRLETMERGPAFQYVCKVAPRYSGRPVWALIGARVPPAEIPTASSALTRLRGTRTVTTVTGPYNLAVCAWLTSPGGLTDFTQAATRLVPRMRVDDTTIALRHRKLGAHVLSAEGLNERFVPPDVWMDAETFGRRMSPSVAGNGRDGGENGDHRA